MLNISNISVSFGGTYLYQDITFRLGAGDRVGLVGKNGAGKSTMLKMLAGDFKPDEGVIASEKEVRLGFLRQDIDFIPGRTVLEEAYQAFEEIKAYMDKKLEYETFDKGRVNVCFEKIYYNNEIQEKFKAIVEKNGYEEK